jgi:hypothetical protein
MRVDEPRHENATPTVDVAEICITSLELRLCSDGEDTAFRNRDARIRDDAGVAHLSPAACPRWSGAGDDLRGVREKQGINGVRPF